MPLTLRSNKKKERKENISCLLKEQKHKMYICKRKIDIKSVSLKLRHNKFYLFYVPLPLFDLQVLRNKKKNEKEENIH